MSILYVALGDSLSVGTGASIFSPGFVQRYQRLAQMELGDHILLQTFAHPGYQSQDVLSEMDKEYVKALLKEANIITITAGGNDLIQAARKFQEDQKEKDFSEALRKCMENFRKIMKELAKLKHDTTPPYIIRLINLYNPFPDDLLAVKWITKFNSLLKNFKTNASISVAEIDKVFKGNESLYLSIDGIHPNDLGYEKISEVLNDLGYSDLDTEEE